MSIFSKNNCAKSIKNLCLLCCCFVTMLLYAQRQYPQDLANPLDIPMVLAGDFGELRPNHFHTGIDIKTQGREGMKVYSVSEGYVSRIKISTTGYGKVIYIIHPNGYESVYAHLREFAPNIEKIVKAEQYRQQRFEIELTPAANEIPVVKREWIGVSGNTGGSYGPHLHFELRDAVTSKVFNPLLFGYKITDNIPPKIYKLIAYPIGALSVVNGASVPTEIPIGQSQEKYTAQSVSAMGSIGFGIKANDYQNGTKNNFGLYKILVKINGIPSLSAQIDELDFSQNTYLNRLIDYPHYMKHKERIQRLYKGALREHSIYVPHQGEGVVKVERGSSYLVEITLEDFSGNRTELSIPVSGTMTPPTQALQQPLQKGCLLTPQKDHLYGEGTHKVYVPKETLYEDTWLQMQAQGDTLTLLPADVPLRKSLQITMKSTQIPDALAPFTAIARLHERTGKPLLLPTKRTNEGYTTHSKNLGTFVLVQDSLPPMAVLKYPPKNRLTNESVVKIKVNDQGSGLKHYNATLNGRWILLEYEPKEQMLFFKVSDVAPLSKGTHQFVLTLTDKIGNKSTFEYLFQLSDEHKKSSKSKKQPQKKKK